MELGAAAAKQLRLDLVLKNSKGYFSGGYPQGPIFAARGRRLINDYRPSKSWGGVVRNEASKICMHPWRRR